MEGGAGMLSNEVLDDEPARDTGGDEKQEDEDAIVDHLPALYLLPLLSRGVVLSCIYAPAAFMHALSVLACAHHPLCLALGAPDLDVGIVVLFFRHLNATCRKRPDISGPSPGLRSLRKCSLLRFQEISSELILSAK